MNKPIQRGTWLALMMLATGLLSAAGGCENGKSGSGGAAPAGGVAAEPGSAPSGKPTQFGTVRLIPAKTAPLTYMLGSGGEIRVVDADTQKVIVTTTAPPQAVIVVDQAAGVSVANTVVKPGPLPAGHKFELWLNTNK